MVVGGASEEEKCVGKLKETLDWSVSSSNCKRGRSVHTYTCIHVVYKDAYRVVEMCLSWMLEVTVR